MKTLKSWTVTILIAASITAIVFGFVSATARADGYAVRTCAPIVAPVYSQAIVQPVCQCAEPIYTIQQQSYVQPIVSYRQRVVQSYAAPVVLRQRSYVQPVILRQRQRFIGGGGGLLNINLGGDRQRIRSGRGRLNIRL